MLHKNSFDGYWPFIVMMPTDVNERVKYMSTLFSSLISLEILNLFEWDRELCQREIIAALHHHSNKTVISMLKKLVEIGILEEKVKPVQRNNRNVKIKCYKLTEIGKWYNLLFRDQKTVDRKIVRNSIIGLATLFLNRFLVYGDELDIDIKEQLYSIIAGVVDSIKRKSVKGRRDLVVFGSIALDIYLTQPIKIFPGGSAANIAVSSSRLGLNTSFIGKAPLDFIGLQLLVDLVEEGVDISLVELDESLKTAICIVSNWLSEYPQISCSYSSDNPPVITKLNSNIIDVCRESKAIYLGEGICNIYVEILKSIGDRKPIVYRPQKQSIELHWEECSQILRYNPLLVLDEDKVEALLRKEFKIPEDLFKAGVDNIIILKGLRKAILYKDKTAKSVDIEMPEISIVNSVGVRDAFIASLIYNLVREEDLEKAVKSSMHLALYTALQPESRKTIKNNTQNIMGYKFS